jgi:MGT family glycosyltransferase
MVARAKAASIARKLGLSVHEISTENGPHYRPVSWPVRVIGNLTGTGVVFGLRSRMRYRAEMVLELAPEALKDLGVDGVVVDQNVLSGGTVAERLGLPFVTACSAVPWIRDVGVPPHFTSWPYGEGRWARLRNRAGYAAWDWYARPTMRLVNRYRAAWKMKPFRDLMEMFSPLAYLGQTCPEFDFPRHELPAAFHYVGALAADRPRTEDDFPWDRLDGRPLIYVSMGTVRPRGDIIVLQKIATACADLDAQLVISAGKWADDSSTWDLPSDLPGDPLMMDFVPQMELLAKARLLITHGGQNTVLEALWQGVPMIALPRAADQPAMAGRIERTGVGLCASFQRFTSAQMREMVERVLTEESFRQRAKQLQQAMLATGGVRRAAEIAERALTTGQPVYRKSEDYPPK